jgi:sulfoacetaldehyde dehydrogenase
MKMQKKKISIKELVKKGRASQSKINKYSQKKIDELVLAVAWEVIKPENNQMLSKMAVRDTGLGIVKDKIVKNNRKTIGLLRDLNNVKTVGIINRNIEKGIIEIARPVGLVGAMLPSTNPIATTLNKIINSLKCRNSIILAPSPKGALVCSNIVNLVHRALRRIGAPIEIVQSLPKPISINETLQLIEAVDLVVATGSQDNIKKAIQTGTPTLGVGVGNVPSIIDSCADLKSAANKIKISKTFDNSTSCSSENSIIILESIYKKFINILQKEGGKLLNKEEKKILGKKLWDDKLILNRNLIAKKATKIAKMIGLNKAKYSKARFLMVQETDVGKKFPFSREKLSPILTIYKATNFDKAVKLTKKILQHQGKGHSCSIHSKSEKNILKLGHELPVCRIIVNQIHCYATGGSFDNGLPFSLSMGCGSWGNNIIDENLSYKHFLNITKIVKTIDANEPSMNEIFSSYWKKYPSTI